MSLIITNKEEIGIVTNSVAILFAIIGPYVAWLSFKKYAVSQTLELFEKFTSGRMVIARKLAWRARPKWFTELSYRQALMKDLFNDTIAAYRKIEIRPEFLEEQAAIYDMLDFFSLLAHHPGNDSALKNLTHYYFWWRGFLWSFIKTYEQEYSKLDFTPEQQRQFPRVGWRRDLELLEKRLSCAPYCFEHHPLDCEFPVIE